jgi:hypothetical protein
MEGSKIRYLRRFKYLLLLRETNALLQTLWAYDFASASICVYTSSEYAQWSWNNQSLRPLAPLIGKHDVSNRSQN